MPSATVEGPTVQVLDHKGTRRLVSHSQPSLSLRSGSPLLQDGIFFAVPNGDGESEVAMYTGHPKDPSRLSMKNGVPYLSKELFWRAVITLL